MSKSPYLVSKSYMTVISKSKEKFYTHFEMIYDCRFEMTAQNFGHENYFGSQKELSYEHKRAMVKRSQMEECSPIRAVFFCFFVTKFRRFQQQDIQCRSLIFVSKRTK